MSILYSVEGFEFEWDDTKATSNFKKHGVSFEEAAEVFLDPFYVMGDASANDEVQEFALGYSLAERLLLVVHIERGQRIRIISARVVTHAERKLYEQS
ncbi:MAG: BrnT family toxin [Leptolyngbyaceae cyanobacterium bins.59]|nr:BrnT family toxin [Leptolyngbyaceae cyanobacterium bins.59]